MPVSERCECGEPFVSNEDGWLTCARGHYERTPESRAEMAEASRQRPRGAVDLPEVERLREAGIRVGMYCCGFSRATATEMFDRELGRVSAALDENQSTEEDHG